MTISGTSQRLCASAVPLRLPSAKMPALGPFLLKPEFHERVWGADDLAPIYAKPEGMKLVGEAWLTGDRCCIVGGGELDGMSLEDATRKFGADLVGDAAPQKDRFPLLVKFLFPRDTMSVQVHPDDDGARRIGQPCGKTECWYVLAAETGATVGVGLKPGTTREEMKRAIDENRAEHLLNWIDVHPGDLIYVDAGTVHAIGPGSVLVEAQQNSDTTFRLYDYGRGRDLHVEQGLAAMKLQTHAGKMVTQGTNGSRRELVSSSYFVIEQHRLDADGGEPLRSFGPNDGKSSARIVVAIDGCGVVESEGNADVTFARGEAVVVPASVEQFAVRAQWTVDFLCAWLPGKPLPPPKTKLV
jgi:mannose-6-phosphate isomerase